jgi:hypothetical protein
MKELEAAGWRKAVEKKKDEITELDIKENRIRDLLQNFRKTFAKLSQKLREIIKKLLRNSSKAGKLTNAKGPRQITEKDDRV